MHKYNYQMIKTTLFKDKKYLGLKGKIGLKWTFGREIIT